MFFKIITDGYITAIGKGNAGIQITEEEYNTLLATLSYKPQETETRKYRLTQELTWEEYYEPPTPIPPQDIDDTEALEIILGGAE